MGQVLSKAMEFIILGMHRSGTSLLASLLHSAGISVGDTEKMDVPTEENPRGFWENRKVRALNDLLLQSLNCDWDRVLGWEVSSVPKEILKGFEQAATESLEELRSSSSWLIKDPRMCLTYRFWSRFLRSQSVLWVVRSPYEVALSLKQRNDFPIDVGLALWEYYNLSVVNLLSKDDAFHLIDYNSLMASPNARIGELQNWIVGRLGSSSSDPGVTIDQSLIEKNLYRNKVDDGMTQLSVVREHPSLSLYSDILSGHFENHKGESLSPESCDVLQRHERNFGLVRYRISRKLEMASDSKSKDLDSSHYLRVINNLLDARVSAAEEMLIRSKEEWEKVSSRLVAVKKERELLTSHCSELEASVEAKTRDIAQLEVHQKSLEAETIELTKRHQTELLARSQEISALKAKLQSMGAEKEEISHKLESDLATRIKEISVLQKRLNSLKIEMAQGRQRIAKLLNSERTWEAHSRALAAEAAKLSETLKGISEALIVLKKSWRWRIGNTLVDVIDRVRLRYPQELASDYIENSILEVLNSASSEQQSLTISPSNWQPSVEAAESRWTEAREVLAGLYPAQYELWERENVRANLCFQELRKSWLLAKPRVMVGTLLSGEREFESCKSSIDRQTYQNKIHRVIEGLPNKEAHSRLYTDFLNSDCEYLIKVDADMVIVDESFIERVVAVMVARPDLAILQIAILDYLSGGEIQGTNAYSKKMKWEQSSQDSLFTDSAPIPYEQRLIVWGTFHRSVIHCPNPAPFQAFHFGVHRAVKVISSLSAGAESRAKEQMLYLARTYQHFGQRRVKNLLFACLGAEFAFRELFTAADIDYTSDVLPNFFSKYENMSWSSLELLLLKMRSEPVKNTALQALRENTNAFGRRAKLSSVLFLLPHFRRFGGVNRFFEMASHLQNQHIQAVVAAPELTAAQVERVNEEFPTVMVCDFGEAMEKSWDCVVCGDFSSAIMTLLPWFDSKLSVVYLLNGWQHRTLNNTQIALAKPDLVIANSSYSALQYPDWAPAIVAGAVDCQMFHPSNEPQPEGVRPFRILVPGGRNKPRKRFEDALQACEIVSAKGIPLEMHVLDAEPVVIEASFTCVTHCKLSRAEVAELMRSVDVALCPEEDAGWNNPAAEAMASGIPVICTEAGTIDFAFDEKTALVVPARSPEVMAEALQRLCADNELRLRLTRDGRTTIEQFNWATLTRKFVDLIETCRLDDLVRQEHNARARRNIKKLAGLS